MVVLVFAQSGHLNLSLAAAIEKSLKLQMDLMLASYNSSQLILNDFVLKSD